MEKGWFKDEGIEITQKPFDASNDATTALLSGNIDIFSNYGTNGPLQTLAAGEDLQIVGGYMATGCMPIITRTDNNDWKGVESLVGKTVAADASDYTIGGALLEKGYDPKFGARPLKRTIQTQVEDLLSEAILEGEIPQGSLVTVKMDRTGEKLKTSIRKRKEECQKV